MTPSLLRSTREGSTSHRKYSYLRFAIELEAHESRPPPRRIEVHPKQVVVPMLELTPEARPVEQSQTVPINRNLDGAIELVGKGPRIAIECERWRGAADARLLGLATASLRLPAQLVIESFELSAVSRLPRNSNTDTSARAGSPRGPDSRARRRPGARHDETVDGNHPVDTGVIDRPPVVVLLERNCARCQGDGGVVGSTDVTMRHADPL